MAEIKRKKSLFEYIVPWALLFIVFAILIFVFNKDNTIKTYNENQVIEVLQDQNPDAEKTEYLEFVFLNILEKNKVVDVSGVYKDKDGNQIKFVSTFASTSMDRLVAAINENTSLNAENTVYEDAFETNIWAELAISILPMIVICIIFFFLFN